MTQKQETKIIIIDSLMGSGKTQWAIQEINNNYQYKNYLYVTPYLSEIDRIRSQTNYIMKIPYSKNGKKLISFNDHLAAGECIITTHSLFKHINRKSIESLSFNKYTLILDEELEVIRPYNDLKKDDLLFLRKGGFINIKENGFVEWIDNETKEFDIRYNDFKEMVLNNHILCVNDCFYLWQYPPEIFSLFDEIYILTYMFEASIMYYYFKLYNINYTKMSICKENNTYKLTPYTPPNLDSYKSLINIHTADTTIQKLNKRLSSLSKSWFNNSNNNIYMPLIKNSLYNFFRNKCKAKTDSTMWTCFKTTQNKLKGKGYTKGFVSCNSRATNEYSNKYNLAYAINRYLNPSIVSFFSERGISVDEDSYALSEMIQWIWRSRIRNDESINVYILSKRMNDLFKKWLNNS